MGQGTDDDYALKITALEDTTCFATVGPLEIKETFNCSIAFPYTAEDSIPAQTAGDVFTIKWNATDTTGKVTLHLYDSISIITPGDSVGRIAVDLDASTGSYDWTVDSFNRGSYDFYRFRIFDFQLTDCGDFSIPFAMTDNVVCSLEVLGIPRDATYDPGDKVTLTFNALNDNGKVDLRLYAGNERVDKGNIADAYDLTQGPFVWTVEDFGWQDDNTRYHVRVIDYQDEWCWGESERFTITR
jgi:hypothetical protein